MSKKQRRINRRRTMYIRQMAEDMANTDKYVAKIADTVYDRMFKDFSRVEDYMKASNERYHNEHGKKYETLERKVNRSVLVIAASLLIAVFFQLIINSI